MVIESKLLSQLLDNGNSPKKSIPIDSQGSEGIDNGFNNPYGF